MQEKCRCDGNLQVANPDERRASVPDETYYASEKSSCPGDCDGGIHLSCATLANVPFLAVMIAMLLTNTIPIYQCAPVASQRIDLHCNESTASALLRGSRWVVKVSRDARR